MSIRETSIKTYHEIISEGIVGKRQEQVMIALRQIAPATDRMITNYLKVGDPNIVRPRRKDLVDMGIVEEVFVDKCKISGRTSIYWNIKKKIQLLHKPIRKICSYCNGRGFIRIEQNKLVEVKS